MVTESCLKEEPGQEKGQVNGADNGPEDVSQSWRMRPQKRRPRFNVRSGGAGQ